MRRHPSQRRRITGADVTLPCSPATLIRLGPQYSFDVGRCPLNDLSACELPDEWTTEALSAGGADSEQVRPSLRYGDGVGMVSYPSSQVSPAGVSVGTFYAWLVESQLFRAFKAAPFQKPCPDELKVPFDSHHVHVSAVKLDAF